VAALSIGRYVGLQMCCRIDLAALCGVFTDRSADIDVPGVGLRQQRMRQVCRGDLDVSFARGLVTGTSWALAIFDGGTT
jgi:hypothetical protein